MSTAKANTHKLDRDMKQFSGALKMSSKVKKEDLA